MARHLLLRLCLVLAGLAAAALPAAAQDWTGEWQSFWRDGLAQITLEQQGDRVTGSYRPDDGEIEGTVQGQVLTGTWREPGSSGGFTFALSDDGQRFTGRFADGEYWNGSRVQDLAGPGTATPLRNATPAEALESVVAGANAAVLEGNAAALRDIAPFLHYEGGSEETTDLTRRRWLLWETVDLATFRLSDAPDGPDRPGGSTASFGISPYRGDATATLRFRLDPEAGWQLVVPPLAELAATQRRLLASLGHDSYSDFAAANDASPRNTLRRFAEGVAAWDSGGREQAMPLLDLSHIPPRLRAMEAALLADFLREILSRIGIGLWQEIPNISDSPEPYVFYVHPMGAVAIEPQPVPGSDPPRTRWVFSAETLAAAPAIYRELQDLPAADGTPPTEPLSDYFRLRESLRQLDPRLVSRDLWLENWQWLGSFAAVIVAALLAWAASALLTRAVLLGMRAFGQARPAEAAAPLRRPAMAFAFVALLMASNSALGLTLAGAGFLGRIFGVALIAFGAALLLAATTVIGRLFLEAAETTRHYMDEIVTTLLLGLLKVIIAVVAVILAADVVGLPYEGVLTGLGIGGVALAFAARETVSNLLGGAILLADRPFKRNDLIEVDGVMATIETVGLRSTRLRTLEDSLMVVPNSRLSDQPIINWGMRRKRRMQMMVSLAYATPAARLEAFREGLEDLFRADPTTDDKDVFVGLARFAESAIEIELTGFLYVFDYGAQVKARHRILMEIVNLAERLEVSFAFPTRVIHMADAPAAAEEAQAAV
ncbi:mechanosensitive ion channel family protein [Mangrovicoccus sp. HB161399]|uniref:mechanosensitive ion channel family protein n=1 Tax=Mangrovicoccus sp. HB161399 TaxID=2720392 RepID=UPI001553587E|nr:mechanosensitive ion channel family protein [Mangrovicoccus sp. HB161399]